MQAEIIKSFQMHMSYYIISFTLVYSNSFFAVSDPGPVYFARCLGACVGTFADSSDTVLASFLAESGTQGTMIV